MLLRAGKGAPREDKKVTAGESKILLCSGPFSALTVHQFYTLTAAKDFGGKETWSQFPTGTDPRDRGQARQPLGLSFFFCKTRTGENMGNH